MNTQKALKKTAVEEGSVIEGPPPKRNIGEVIDRVRAALPQGRSVQQPVAAYALLDHKLAHIKESAGYTSPEGMGRHWYDLCHLLEKSLPFPPETPWQQEIADIITAKK